MASPQPLSLPAQAIHAIAPHAVNALAPLATHVIKQAAIAAYPAAGTSSAPVGSGAARRGPSQTSTAGDEDPEFITENHRNLLESKHNCVHVSMAYLLNVLPQTLADHTKTLEPEVEDEQVPIASIGGLAKTAAAEVAGGMLIVKIGLWDRSKTNIDVCTKYQTSKFGIVFKYWSSTKGEWQAHAVVYDKNICTNETPVDQKYLDFQASRNPAPTTLQIMTKSQKACSIMRFFLFQRKDGGYYGTADDSGPNKRKSDDP